MSHLFKSRRQYPQWYIDQPESLSGKRVGNMESESGKASSLFGCRQRGKQQRASPRPVISVARSAGFRVYPYVNRGTWLRGRLASDWWGVA